MSLLEIILLVLLVVSLVANFRLWQYFQAYKKAYRAAIAFSYPAPSLLSSLTSITCIVGVGVMIWAACKRFKEDKNAASI
jgi:NAD-dependent DNA ligase